MPEDILYTPLSHCSYCACKEPLTKLSSLSQNIHTASVWNGAQWEMIKHGTKKCCACKSRFKLNYLASQQGKWNTLTPETLEPSSILLVHPSLGFRYSYLHLLWHRVCRANVSFLAEASSIILATPHAVVGNDGKRRGKSTQKLMTDHRLSLHINQALFCYLRFQEKVWHFSVDDPVPKNDKEYGTPLKDTHIIFNEPESDPQLETKFTKLDIVTDGCIPLARPLVDDERKKLKRLVGKPKPMNKTKKDGGGQQNKS